MKKLVIKLLAIFIASGLALGILRVEAKSESELLQSKIRGVSKKEIESIISNLSKTTGKPKEIISKEILDEIRNKKVDSSLQNNISLRSSGSNSSEGFTLNKPKYYGDIFYEPASFLYEYGHVGIYYSNTTIVESNPGKGVHKNYIWKKRVDRGSKIFTLYNVSEKISNDASNWAYSRIGDSYSMNFFNNRSTGCYGDKNCSKLVWCAYKIAAGVDIDSDKGYGVYPKDILNYKYVRVYKSY